MSDAAAGGIESAARPEGGRPLHFPCFDGLRAIAPDTVVSGHGMVLRGDRLRTALADRSPPANGAAAAALELRAALAALAAGRWC